MDSVAFLKMVWGNRRGWVDMPSKIRGHWMPFYFEWPDEEMAQLRLNILKGGGRRSGDSREHMWFSVAQFSQRGRLEEFCLPMAWLWADLDLVDPQWPAEHGLEPTIAWESSPGRFQALWRLNREMKPKALAMLNRKLTYWLHADRGGWDLTQVLRIPGTRNWKYKNGPEVEIVLDGGPTYDPAEVLAIVRSGETIGRRVLKTKAERRTAKAAELLPAKAKRLLTVRPEMVVEGERSHRRWELECLLAESGLDSDEIVSLVADTPWNSWSGRATAERQLRREAAKAIRHVQSSPATNGAKTPARAKKTPVRGVVKTEDIDTDEILDLAEDDDDEEEAEDTSLPFMEYSELMTTSFEDPEWLVEGIWMKGSNGLIAGDPKSSKTFLGLALAMSVATGLPFLEEYSAVKESVGPALVIQEENSPWDIVDKLKKLAHYAGILGDVKDNGGDMVVQFPYDVPLYVLNNYGFNMELEEHRESLEEFVDEIKPSIIVFDPLYLMLGNADENSSAQLRPFLRWLLALRYEYGTSVAVCHHFGKGSHQKHGHRALGSSTLYGWVDSALWCEAMPPEDDWNRIIKVEREFRSVAPQVPLEIKMNIGEAGTLELEVEAEDWVGEVIDFPSDNGEPKKGRKRRVHWADKVLQEVTEKPGITAWEVAEEFGVTKAHAMKGLSRLLEQEKVERVGPGVSGNAYRWYPNGNAG